MPSEPLCAVALAAGAGQRLRPLTLVRPKPLCPVDNVALLDLALTRLAPLVAGPGDVAVNVHHGRDQMLAHLEDHAPDVHRSIEAPEALGTAGALGLLRSWIDGRDTVVVNADTWCPGSLAEAVVGWDRKRVRLLLAGEDKLRRHSRIVAAFLPWSEVSTLAPVPSGLYEASWRRLAGDGLVDAAAWDGPCFDCGTPQSYLAANLAASGGESVVGKDAVVEGELVRSVVWDGVEVRPGERLVDAIRAEIDVTVYVR